MEHLGQFSVSTMGETGSVFGQRQQTYSPRVVCYWGYPPVTGQPNTQHSAWTLKTGPNATVKPSQ